MAVSVMTVLTVINFLNYIDRYLLSSVLEGIKLEFALTDGQSGRLFTLFMIVYMLISPFTGWLGDRRTRKYLVAGGVALWSLATIGSGYADSYEELSVMRALVGVGEAGYATVAPGMIADIYEPKRRGRMLAYFYIAIPVGAALGFMFGGIIAEYWSSFISADMLALLGLADAADPGWRLAFIIAGSPGLLFAVLAALMPEPKRGAMDPDEVEEAPPEFTKPMDILRRLLQSPGFRTTTGGMVLMTFTVGGLGAWMPTFFTRGLGMTEGEAGMVFGGITVVAGLAATLVGGVLGDRAFAKSQGGYLRVSGWGLLIATPAVASLLVFDAKIALMLMAFVAEFFLFLNTGPLNAALVGCVPSNLRASSIALNVLLIHGLGDAISPWLIGATSDAIGPALAGGSLGATAGAAGLRLAIALTAIPVLAGGLWLLRGATMLDEHPEGLAAWDKD